jgi:Tol biopolymer transport system component
MSSRLALVWLLLAGITLGLLLRPADASPGVTERVSVDSQGNQADGSSGYPAISGDGRYIAFISSASNLVPGDTNGFDDVFVHDRETGQTRRVSVASDGTQGDSYTQGGYIPRLAISANGLFVAFTSQARNLDSDDTNMMPDVFVHDMETEETSRVSVSDEGRQFQGSSELIEMSPDGRYVTFFTQSGLMVRDVVGGKTERQAHPEHDFSSESYDGRYLAVLSLASNIVPNDDNGMYDIFVHDRATNVIKSPTVGIQPRGFGPILQAPVISGNGRHVVFSLGLSETSVFDTTFRLFVYDAVSDTTEMLLTAESGPNGDTLSQHSISFDGRYIAFASSDPNLVSGHTNFASDIFVLDRGPQPEAPSPPPFEPPSASPSPDARATLTAFPCPSPTPLDSTSPSPPRSPGLGASPEPVTPAESPVVPSPPPITPSPLPQEASSGGAGYFGTPPPSTTESAPTAEPTQSPESTPSVAGPPCTEPQNDEIQADEEVSLNIGRLAGVSAILAGAAVGLSALALRSKARRRR